ncbi:hypothetical protein EDB85DRAFT_2139172 [Lactarius pseudohatsudake]|nr:hypothetical protein EDB85DRAFT_2139172 [Lactarius pseudohatsudake]
MPGILTTNSLLLPLSRVAPIFTAPRCARRVSSSPYGRTHVWKRRPNKLPNPIVPQFPQRVIRADGSSFTHWTTSPRPLIRLTRDVTNHPLWNVSALTGEGAAEESEVTGRLGRFNRKFVEEIDWMSEAEGGSETTQTKKATPAAGKK